MLDLPLRDQLLHRAGNFLDRYIGIDAVLVEQVDLLDAEPLERSLGNRADMLGPAVQARLLHAARDVEAELGGDHHPVTHRAQRFADQAFIGEGAIDFGSVEERDAAIDGGAQQGAALRRAQLAAIGEIQPHAAIADRRDFEAVAENALLHVLSS